MGSTAGKFQTPGSATAWVFDTSNDTLATTALAAKSVKRQHRASVGRAVRFYRYERTTRLEFIGLDSAASGSTRAWAAWVRQRQCCTIAMIFRAAARFLVLQWHAACSGIGQLQPGFPRLSQHGQTQGLEQEQCGDVRVRPHRPPLRTCVADGEREASQRLRTVRVDAIPTATAHPPPDGTHRTPAEPNRSERSRDERAVSARGVFAPTSGLGDAQRAN